MHKIELSVDYIHFILTDNKANMKVKQPLSIESLVETFISRSLNARGWLIDVLNLISILKYLV